MKDATLLKIALSWSLIGIFCLLFFAESFEPSSIKIKDAEKNLGKTVMIVGDVTDYTAKDKVTFVNIKDDTGELLVVSFEKIKKIPINTRIEVTGKIATYKGALEIIADEIKCYY